MKNIIVLGGRVNSRDLSLILLKAGMSEIKT